MMLVIRALIRFFRRKNFFAPTILIINSKYHTLWAMSGDIVHFENAMKKMAGPQRTFSSAFVFSAAFECAPADSKIHFRDHLPHHDDDDETVKVLVQNVT